MGEDPASWHMSKFIFSLGGLDRSFPTGQFVTDYVSTRFGEWLRPICSTKSATRLESDGEGSRSRGESVPLSIRCLDSQSLDLKTTDQKPLCLMGRFTPEFKPILWKLFSAETGKLFGNNQGHLMAKRRE
jgi:hypothetical protein